MTSPKAPSSRATATCSIGGSHVTELAHLIAPLTVLVLAVFVGFEVISKVPTTLHTPLMSATNAIHGIVLAGAIVIVAALFGASARPGAYRSRRRRSDARRDQRLRRLRRDRTHVADVPPARRTASERCDRSRRSGRDRALYLRTARAKLAGDRAARQSLRDARHAHRAGRYRRAHRRGRVARGGGGRRNRRARRHLRRGQSEDDRDAADGRTLQRRRRRRGGPDLDGRVFSRTADGRAWIQSSPFRSCSRQSSARSALPDRSSRF